jgi:predicted Zn-dependent peptidase
MRYIFLIFLQGVILMSATLKELTTNNTTIPVIYEKYTTLPIFNLQLVFTNSGYIYDGSKKGITHLSANLLNEGTKKDGAVAFARKLENKAISIDTNTGLETFVIELSCLKEDYKQALKYLYELLKDPNITQDTLQKLQTLQLSNISQKEDDFDYVASKNLKKIQFPNTPLSSTKLGDAQAVGQITLDDVANRLKQILSVNNLIIVVGGDIQYKEFKKSFIPILTLLNTTKSVPFQRYRPDEKQKVSTITKETQQAYIYFSSPFDMKYNSKDAYKAKVASFILGSSGFGSRLMEQIRVKAGLAYSAYGYIENKKSYSQFTGYLQTKLQNQSKAQKMVQDIVNQFVQDGVTQEELDAAKQFLSGSEPLRTETFSQRLNRAFNLYYKGLSFDYPQKELENINKLTLNELNNFIKQHKEITKLSFSIVTK